MSNKQTTTKEFYNFIKNYIDDYEVIDDSGDYTPSDAQKAIAFEIVMGLLKEEKFTNPIKEGANKIRLIKVEDMNQIL